MSWRPFYALITLAIAFLATAGPLSAKFDPGSEIASREKFGPSSESVRQIGPPALETTGEIWVSYYDPVSGRPLWTMFDPLGLESNHAAIDQAFAQQPALLRWFAKVTGMEAGMKAGLRGADDAMDRNEAAGKARTMSKKETAVAIAQGTATDLAIVGLVTAGASGGVKEVMKEVVSESTGVPLDAADLAKLAKNAPESVADITKSARRQADETAAAGTGGKPDFIVTEKGTVVPTNQAQMRQGFDDAGFPSKPTQSPGVEHTLPDGSKVRTMEPSGGAPRRASFENANGQPITPDGTVPQPPKGMTKAERKQFVRDRTHVEQQ